MFLDHHVFILFNDVNPELQSVLLDNGRNEFLKINHPVPHWMDEFILGEWSFIVFDAEPDVNFEAEETGRYRDWWQTYEVRFSFENRMDAIRFKLLWFK